MQKPTMPLSGNLPTNTSLDMLKRVLAVAELIAKSSQPASVDKQSPPPELSEKTQK